MKVMVKTTNEDYGLLLDALDACGYHWMSGQKANEPPTLFKTVGSSSEDHVWGIRIINPTNKLIGYFPIEVLDASEQDVTLLKSKTVEQTIRLLEKYHRRDLAYLHGVQTQKTKHQGHVNAFMNALRRAVMDQYQIDIVELIETTDETLVYIKEHAPGENLRKILCMDAESLYQDYLGNTMGIEEYAHHIGARYEYLITELEKREQELREPEPVEEADR